MSMIIIIYMEKVLRIANTQVFPIILETIIVRKTCVSRKTREHLTLRGRETEKKINIRYSLLGPVLALMHTGLFLMDHVLSVSAGSCEESNVPVILFFYNFVSNRPCSLGGSW